MAQAGGRHSPQDRVKSMTAKLGLTAEQQSQATTIFSNAQATESTLRASMKTAHQGLNDAVRSNNTVGIEQLAATIGNLTAQLTLAQQDRVKSMTAKLGLTAEQQSQATTIFSNAQATESTLRV